MINSCNTNKTAPVVAQRVEPEPQPTRTYQAPVQNPMTFFAASLSIMLSANLAHKFMGRP